MEHLPDDNCRYKEVSYWDERYRVEQSFDWVGEFSKFKHLLEKLVDKEDSILVLGCGNSTMSSEMYDCGFRRITNIDYSSVCVRTMVARHAARRPLMAWRQMDMRQLEFADAAFDVVLEKATLDALMVEDKDPWEVSPHTACLLQQVLTEVSRVLRPGGRFLSLTFAQPHFRRPLYARAEYGWSVAQQTYGDGFHYFLYVMTAGEGLGPEDIFKEARRLEPRPPTAQTPPTRIAVQQDSDSEDFLKNIDL